ncbi:hypothetical protein JDV02_004224 [Purpureocillium takamizusanense]|uniref:Prolyl 4-hydroxylase alpha subunit Fe(2+) 2OG dioxygenase domain-containing protein n=1 Tax=Purpureocillium takamizusanense TaxID=2060973 RepID=A0A9Q8QFV5_9HYPO|nr:uncharacterized protein JDV02_004224 [Purpureocillium takamizusanense]UNI17917.1 hypothetical protein JDV02_004224 [Purpureocillium takamizusanense]
MANAHGLGDMSAGGEPDLRGDLLNELDNIQTPGSFATIATLPDAPPAGLFVDGLGEVSMPLGEAQAARLIDKCRHAPFGRKEETLVDLSVRKCWEMDRSQFSFRDPAWPSYLKMICANVALDLGIDAVVHAEIYKMLIYGEGAMFKAHTDTEKCSGMFGTLVVCLPSAHGGGDVVVKHCGQAKLLSSSATAQSYLAWYSDVSHEVLPVTSGYRWVLTFNLTLDTSIERPLVGGHQSQMRAVRQILTGWLGVAPESRQNKCLLHVLDHDYTEANMSIGALKARDLAQVQALRDLSTELGYEVFLGLLTKEELGTLDADYDHYHYDHYDDDDDESEEGGFHDLADVCSTNHSFKTLFGLDGRMIAQEVDLAEDDLLTDGYFDDRECEEDRGYTGNEGGGCDPLVSCGVPHDGLHAFLSKSSYDTSDIQPLIRYYARLCLQRPSVPAFPQLLWRLCRTVWEQRLEPDRPSWRPLLTIDGEGLHGVVKVALAREEYTVFEQAASNHKGAMLHSTFAAMMQWVQRGEDVEGRFRAIKKGLCLALSSFNHFSARYRAIRSFMTVPKSIASPDPESSCIRGWARATIRECLDACLSSTVLGPLAGSDMVDCVQYFENPTEFFSLYVMPKLDRRLDQPAFYLALMAQLRRHGVDGSLPIGWVKFAHRLIAECFLRSVSFTRVRGVSSSTQEASAKRPRLTSGVHSSVATAVSTQALADFFSAIDDPSEPDYVVTLFVRNVVEAAPGLAADEFEVLWIPYLRWLAGSMASKEIPFDTPRYQRLFVALLSAYLLNYVGREPPNDTSLVRQGVDCDCGICSELNDFLADGTRRVARYPLNKENRSHVH